MMEKIKVGVIGCGYWGPNLIRNFIELPSSDLKFVADLKEERLSHMKNLYPRVAITKDYGDFLNNGIEAVVVATPPSTHFIVAKECLEHGMHVMVEKPITLDSSQAKTLIELAQKQDLILMVGHTFVYNSAVLALKQLINSGELGKIYYVDAARLNLGLFSRDLNVLWDLAPHDIAILLYILGQKPISVTAQGISCVLKGIQDVVYLNLTFPASITAHIHLSWLDPCKVRRTTVVGSQKMAVFNDLDPLGKIRIYDKGVDAPAYTDTYSDWQCNYRYGDILIPNIRVVEPLRQECQHFLECIIGHNEPRSGGRDGLEVVQVLEAAQRSLMNVHTQEIIKW
jgi:predicted dehydrogenase